LRNTKIVTAAESSADILLAELAKAAYVSNK
jgi:hypothetical protein